MIDELCQAAQNGEIEKVIRLIEKDHVDVNARHSIHKTPPLAFAVQNGHLEMVKLLVHYGANIFYCEEEKSQKHLFLWALLSSNSQSIIAYLEEQGLQLDLARCYYDISDSLCLQKNFISQLIGNKEWDFLFSILKRDLKKINTELLYCRLGKGHVSLLEEACNNGDKNKISTTFAYLFINYILKTKATNFESLHEELLILKKEILAQQCYPYISNSHLDNQIKILTNINTYFQNLILIQHFLSHSHEYQLKNFPGELWLNISKHIISFYLPDMQENDIKKLIDIFVGFNKPFAQNEQGTFNNMAKITFREWRFAHQYLFLFQSPSQKAALDIYRFLESCFCEKFSKSDMPFTLRNNIVAEVVKLGKNDFNRPGVLQAIDNAMKLS